MEENEPLFSAVRALAPLHAGVLRDDRYQRLLSELASIINQLLLTNKDKLISILYRMDVSEKKLRQVLSDNVGEDAGLLIATLVIDREAEKIKSRRQFSQRDDTIDENEKW